MRIPMIFAVPLLAVSLTGFAHAQGEGVALRPTAGGEGAVRATTAARPPTR